MHIWVSDFVCVTLTELKYSFTTTIFFFDDLLSLSPCSSSTTGAAMRPPDGSEVNTAPVLVVSTKPPHRLRWTTVCLPPRPRLQFYCARTFNATDNHGNHPDTDAPSHEEHVLQCERNRIRILKFYLRDVSMECGHRVKDFSGNGKICAESRGHIAAC